MCGIVSVTNFKDSPVNELVEKMFQNQRTRGTEGFGLFDHEYGNLIRSTGEKRILKWLGKYPSRSILFHHRLPTSTDNVRNACHPFSTRDFFRTNYVMVHNGSISNDLELKKAHEKLGIKYYSEQPDGSFNDSEALLWDLALYLEGKQEGLKAEGGIAFTCIAVGKGNKHDKLYFGRNSYPLNLMFNDEVLMVSSEGEGEPIDSHKLYCYDYVNGKLTSKTLTVPTRVWAGTYGGYDNGYWNDQTKKWTYHDDPVRRGLYEDDDDELGVVGHEYILLRGVNTIIKDISDSMTSAMWQADGNYYDAIMRIDEKVDTLYSLKARTTFSWELDDIEYTIDILITAQERITESEGYKNMDSVDENFSYSLAVDDGKA